MTTSRFFRTDHVEDVAGSIRHALKCAEHVRQDPHEWKWLILALHSALQGACVCHLSTTAAPIGAVKKDSAEKWIRYSDNPSGEAPKTFLMELPDLLESVRKPEAAGGGGIPGRIISINNRELQDLTDFHKDFRNPLVHFEPMTWVLDVSGLPQLTKLVARIISEIVEYGWAFRRHEGAGRMILADLVRLQEMVLSAVQTD